MTPDAPRPHLSWLGILRLGLVQTSLGAIIVLTTSTLNRVMVVELMLPAMLPGALVAINHATQILRPRWGFGSDVGGRRTPWIIGGMAVLALGGVTAAVATAWMEANQWAGIALAVLAFCMIGIGSGAAGTTLLVLLAKRVAPKRRAAAATIVWVMMLFGFVVTAASAGSVLDPFTLERMVLVTAVVAAIAFLVSVVAVWGVEGRAVEPPLAPEGVAEEKPTFGHALREVWAEPQARRFTLFVFVAMLAYSMQDLILEPFAGIAFGLTPGQSTQLSSVHHGGVLIGMLIVGIAGSAIGGHRFGSLRLWSILGCIASAGALAGLFVAGQVGPPWPLHATVAGLGVANGVFAVAAIGSMMGLAAAGRARREGVRMGLWGAAQGIAMGSGEFLGTVFADALSPLFGSQVMAYGSVFAMEAVLFLVAASLAARVGHVKDDTATIGFAAIGEGAAAGVGGS